MIKRTTRYKGDAARAHREVGGKNSSPRGKQSVDNIGISSFSRQKQRGIMTAAQHMSINKGVA